MARYPVLLLSVLAGCGSGDRRPAPAPLPSVPVSSVELRSGTPGEVREACRQVRRLRVPPVCPRRYPASGFVTTGDTETDRWLRAPNVYSPELYELSFNNGDNRGYVHWVMGVGTADVFDREILRGAFAVVPGPRDPPAGRDDPRFDRAHLRVHRRTRWTEQRPRDRCDHPGRARRLRLGARPRASRPRDRAGRRRRGTAPLRLPADRRGVRRGACTSATGPSG